MNPIELRDLLVQHGAILEGHFRLSSGLHSDVYVQKQRIMEHPRIAGSLAHHLAERFRTGDTYAFETVVSPAVGAIGFGTLLAFEAHARFLFTERVDGAMHLRRAQTLRRNERVLIVEDIVTTGGSAAEVVEAVKATGAHLVGVAALVDRSLGQLPFALTSLAKIEAKAVDAADCPMCARGEPIDDPGSRSLTG